MAETRARGAATVSAFRNPARDARGQGGERTKCDAKEFYKNFVPKIIPWGIIGGSGTNRFRGDKILYIHASGFMIHFLFFLSAVSVVGMIIEAVMAWSTNSCRLSPP